MRIRTAIAVAALLPASLAFAIAPAQDDTSSCRVDEERTVTVDNEDGTTSDVPVEYCESSIWAVCDNTLDPAGKVYDPTIAITMDATEPSESFTAGAGCGVVDQPLLTQVTHEPGPGHNHFSGFLLEAGNVDSLTFEVHFLGPNTGYAGQPIDLDLRMTVDGESLFGTTTETGATGTEFESPSQRTVTAVPVLSSTGASTSVRITVEDLAGFLPDVFAAEAGAGALHRQVKISLDYPFDTTTGLPAGVSQVVFGATEVPTGVTLNTTAEDRGVVIQPGAGA